MGVQNTTTAGLSVPQDTLAKRLRWAIIASILLNMMGWRAVAAMAKRPLYVPPRPVEVTRVIIDNKGHRIVKNITKEQIKQHVVKIKKPPPQRLRQAAYHPPQKAPAPPQHSNVLTATDKGSGNGEPVVAAGGDAKVGVPVVQQPDPVPPPVPVIKPDPVPVAKTPDPVKPTPPPPVVKAPDPPPVIKQPDPPPAPVTKSGPTKDAEPSNEVKPEIPDSLKHRDFKSFVRVRVEIDEDGNATPILRTSSGNAEIDQRVLDALKRWKWKPALENGDPIKSTQLFKFEFLVD